MPRLSHFFFALLCLSLLATALPESARAYTVKAGDTPISIAKKHGISTEELMKANKGLQPSKIHVGDTLTIPGSSSKTEKKHSEKESKKKEKAEKKQEAAPSSKERASESRDREKDRKSSSKSTHTYTVKKGDTLGSIASKHDVSVDDILKANKGLKPSRIKIGEEIALPGGAPAKAETAEKPSHKAEKAKETRESREDTTTYTAHKHDTVSSVARKFHISHKELSRLNPSLGKKLHSGQKLIVPAQQAEEAPAKHGHPSRAAEQASEPEVSAPEPVAKAPAPAPVPETPPARPTKTPEAAAPAATPTLPETRGSADADALFEKGIEFGKQNKFQKAIESFDKAIKLNPNRADFYASRGHANYYLKQYPKAIDDYTKAIEKNPNFALVYSMRGLSRTRSGQYQQALEDFNKAINLGPNEADYYKGRGFTYLHLKQYGPMCQDYQKACTLGDCELLNSAKKEKLCQ